MIGGTAAGLLLDHHIAGFRQILRNAWQEIGLAELMDSLDFQIATMEDWRLPIDLPDDQLLAFAQAHRLILFSANRKSRDANSLHVSLQSLSDSSLPVLTPGSLERTLTDRKYRLRLAKSIAEIVFGIETTGEYLGYGRIYIPLDQDR